MRGGWGAAYLDAQQYLDGVQRVGGGNGRLPTKWHHGHCRGLSYDVLRSLPQVHEMGAGQDGALTDGLTRQLPVNPHEGAKNISRNGRGRHGAAQVWATTEGRPYQKSLSVLILKMQLRPMPTGRN